MTRFELLNLLAQQQRPVKLKVLAALAGTWRKIDTDSMRIQLRRMHRWGLVHRRRIPFSARSFNYQISMKGRERLIWARRKGLLDNAVNDLRPFAKARKTS